MSNFESGGGDRLVIGAGRLNLGAMARAPLVALMVLIVTVVVALGFTAIRDGQGYLAAILGIAFLSPFAYLGLAMRNFKIVAIGKDVSFTNWRGRTIRFSRSRIKEVVIRRVRLGGSAYPMALVIGLDGKVIARWGANGAAGERLIPLWRQLGIEPDKSVSEPLGVKALRTEYPGSVSWVTAHTRLTSFLVGGIAIAAWVVYGALSPK
jgi:hypothetical protein